MSQKLLGSLSDYNISDLRRSIYQMRQLNSKSSSAMLKDPVTDHFFRNSRRQKNILCLEIISLSK